MVLDVCCRFVITCLFFYSPVIRLRIGAQIIDSFQSKAPPRTVPEGIFQMRPIKVLHAKILLEWGKRDNDKGARDGLVDLLVQSGPVV